MHGMTSRVWWTLALLVVGCGGGEPAGEPAAEPDAQEPDIDFIQEAVWSPAGDRLIASWNQGNRFRLYAVMGPDTAGTAQGTSAGLPVSDGPDVWASWSPDGLWLAFGTTRDGQGEIYRMRPDGVQEENLTNDPADDREPAFSPDGQRIAFISDRTDGSPRLHIMNADGTDVRMVGNPPGTENHGPSWSPDGRRILVSARLEDGIDAIYVTTPSGGWGQTRAGRFPSWAPDSDQFYFSRGDTVFTARVSTNARLLITEDGFAPRVSPDGRWLAFVRGAWPQSALWVHDLETGRQHRLTR